MLDPKFGISTFWLHGINIKEAIKEAIKLGFGTFEITTSRRGIVGFPPMSNAGVDVFECNNEERKNLKELLKDFNNVTVHASHFGVNIASPDYSVRVASRKHYLEAIKFAYDVGATIVSFHPGYKERRLDNDQEIVSWNIDFAEEASKLCSELGIKLAIENVLPGVRGAIDSRTLISKVIEEVNHPNLGLLLDTGWAIKEREILTSIDVTSDFILPWFETLGDKIVELHVHGILICNFLGYLHHQPLWQDNCHDFTRLSDYINRYSANAPIVFEIIGKDADTVFHLTEEGARYLSGLQSA